MFISLPLIDSILIMLTRNVNINYVSNCFISVSGDCMLLNVTKFRESFFNWWGRHGISCFMGCHACLDLACLVSSDRSDRVGLQGRLTWIKMPRPNERDIFNYSNCVLNEVMNLSVSKKARNFSTWWVTISFWRIIFLTGVVSKWYNLCLWGPVCGFSSRTADRFVSNHIWALMP